MIPSVEWTTIFRWHLLLAIAAYAFLMIAFVHAVLMALINRRLKSPAVGETSKFLDSMPALVVMERIFFRIVVVGFLFITLTLIVGELDRTGFVRKYNELWSKRTGLPIRWVEGAAHNSNADSPAAVNAIIEEALAKGN